MARPIFTLTQALSHASIERRCSALPAAFLRYTSPPPSFLLMFLAAAWTAPYPLSPAPRLGGPFLFLARLPSNSLPIAYVTPRRSCKRDSADFVDPLGPTIRSLFPHPSISLALKWSSFPPSPRAPELLLPEAEHEHLLTSVPRPGFLHCTRTSTRFCVLLPVDRFAFSLLRPGCLSSRFFPSSRLFSCPLDRDAAP